MGISPPDALGSVRQIVDANGNVTLAKSYEPYGTVLTSNGTASSIFAYAGEQIDTTGLIYLRARYMNPKLGIFLARDPWSGDVMRPGSMNGYSYVEGNPVNTVDPSGRISKSEWLYINYLYACCIENATKRLNVPSLTNMSNKAFASMIAAKILVEDATIFANEQPLGVLKQIATIPTGDLPDWQRDLAEATVFRGEISWGPANIPFRLALPSLEWWEQNHSCLGLSLNALHTFYYDYRDAGWLAQVFIGSEKTQLAYELQLDSGAVEGMALAILWSADRARSYWASIGQVYHQLSAYTVALGVLEPDRQKDAILYIPSNWSERGFAGNWVDALSETAVALGLSLSIPGDYLDYTDEEGGLSSLV